MENILDMVNQKVQDALKKFQNTINKEHKNTQKQLNKFSEDFNKHQSQTKDTINKRDIWNKENSIKYKGRIKQRYGEPQKKESNNNPGNKKSL
jgi:hypothetical protein